MSNISLIKTLRESTGAGMLDCKKALSESNNDIEKAQEWLRKKGISAAAKKSGRIAAEGLIAQKTIGNNAAVIELNSETDFVAKNENFQNLANDVLDSILNAETDHINEIKLSNGQLISESITNAVSIIGENIKLRRFKKINNDNGYIASYIHNSVSDTLGKIGVLVSLNCDNVDENVKKLAKQIAMHIAASKPISANISDVPTEYIEKEKEIFSEQARSTGKPENIIEKMVEGRIRKYYEEVVLLEQPFVIDGKKKVKEILEDFEKQNNVKVSVNEFSRFEIGEGIEKKDENFADEVHSIANQA